MIPESFSFHPLFYLGLLLLCGYGGGRIAGAIKLPRISGYIIAGIILSPSFLNLLPERLVHEDLTLVTDIALGVIAFAIGGALELEMLKRLGKQIFLITIVQALSVFLLVALIVLTLFPMLGGLGTASSSGLFALAIILGAISAATAPGPILGVVHEYRARGPLTTVLLGVVTLDDGVTILLFSIGAGVAGALIGGDQLVVTSLLSKPLIEIATSLIIGGAAGIAIRFIAPFIRRTAAVLGIALGSIFLVSGLSITLHASGLLANMALGFTIANLVRQPGQWFQSVNEIEEPVMAMFFVLAGAHLRLDYLVAAGSLAVLVIVGRSAGKILGSLAGARISGSSEAVRRYLPFGLLPQAGVSLGLVLAAQDLFPDKQVAELLVNAILASVIVNELISPPLVKMALVKAGETRPDLLSQETTDE